MSELAKDDVTHLKYLLSTAFLCGLPTSRALWHQVKLRLRSLSRYLNGKELADLVVLSTVRHPIALQYPMNHGYMRGVLLWLKGVWAEHLWAGEENLHVCQTDAAPVGAERLEIGYKSYPFDEEGSYITLLESFEGISRGTTGLSSWGAAQVLASWCIGNPEGIGDKRIVELGAGTGYTAVSILSSSATGGGPATYTATDYHPHVLSILHHNLSLLQATKEKSLGQLLKFCVEMNAKMADEELPPGEFRLWKPNPGFTKGNTKVEILQLDWRNPSPDLPHCDVILAADVVYAVHLFPDLVQIIRKLLSSSGQAVIGTSGEKDVSPYVSPYVSTDLHFGNGRNDEARTDNEETVTTATSESFPGGFMGSKRTEMASKPECFRLPTPKAFVACTRRNQETVSEFLAELTNQGLSYKMVFQTIPDRGMSSFAYDESYKLVQIFEILL